MRVAYVCADPGVPVFGQKGCSIHVQEVIRALRMHGACVDLFAASADGTPTASVDGVRLHTLPDARGSHTRARERAAVLANAPLIEEQAEHRTLLDKPTALLIAKDVFDAAHTIAAVSTGAAEYVERFIGAATKLHVVPNGVDPTRFLDSPTPRRRRSDDAFTIGFVGSLKPWHGLSTLTQAFATLHADDARHRLLIVGDGPERASIERSLGEDGVNEATRFTGPVTHDRIPSLLASMDAAVAPYTARPHFYFSPLKVLEYMAAGLPVVASRVGQLEELIVDGETGLLCPPDDPRALADCLQRLREDRDLCLRLGSAARSVVVGRHTWHAVTSRILALSGVRTRAEVSQ